MSESEGRARPDVVCKLGGSLVDAGRAPALMETLREVAAGGTRVLVVPGGGAAADRVRAEYVRGGMTQHDAHWKALAALDGVGERLARLAGEGSVRLVRDREALAAALADGGLAVLAPRDPLRRAESRAASPLPHTWRVTSDSVAAWFALDLGARRVVLLKARDAVPSAERARTEERLPAARAAVAGIVDPHLPELLANATLECRLVNGRYPERVERVLRGEPAISTELV